MEIKTMDEVKLPKHMQKQASEFLKIADLEKQLSQETTEYSDNYKRMMEEEWQVDAELKYKKATLSINQDFAADYFSLKYIFVGFLIAIIPNAIINRILQAILGVGVTLVIDIPIEIIIIYFCFKAFKKYKLGQKYCELGQWNDITGGLPIKKHVKRCNTESLPYITEDYVRQHSSFFSSRIDQFLEWEQVPNVYDKNVMTWEVK